MNDDGTVIAVPIEIDELPSEGRERLDELFRSDPLMHQLGGALVSWSPGQSTVTAAIDKSHTNFIGGGHGGILFSLGDIAMSFASNGYGRQCLATQINISYHRGVLPGDLIAAVATEINRTRRFAHYRLDLSVEKKLVASATGTTYRTNEWHFGDEAWPDTWREKY